MDKLIGLAKVGPLSISKWAVPIEVEVDVGPDGNYNFPHLPVGAYTFFYSAPGLAPVSKDLVVVQDGLGAVLDVTLERANALRVRIDFPVWPHNRLTLIPHRWWPELPTAVIVPLGSAAEFCGLGGPLRKGLIVSSGESEASEWRVVGRYDLDVSDEARIVLAPSPASVLDVPEAAGFEPWDGALQPAKQLLYGAISPIALFWPVAEDDSSFLAAMADFRAEISGIGSRGNVRGFSPLPFLPVLAESKDGGAWLVWSSDASEFEFVGLPNGEYKIRALELFGNVTFAKGISVASGSQAKLSEGAWTKPELDEPDSREIKGFVRWEGGAPASKASVFVQHSQNFRLYLRRVETDENGYFRVGDVPGDAPFFAFALPPGDESSMREFDYFAAFAGQREVWRELTLHPHRISGQLGARAVGMPLQLVRIDPAGDRVVISFEADASGRFVVANVPHGSYRVQSTPSDGTEIIRSQPFEVAGGRSEEIVIWP